MYSLSKRLKKRIIELCGFLNLNRNEKLSRANEILNSTEVKNSICNQIQGATFKDTEKTMLSIINERQVTEEQQEILELQEKAPDKFDYDFEFKLNKPSLEKKKEIRYTTYTLEEVAALLAASKASTIPEPKKSFEELFPPGPYPQELIERQQQLIKEHFEYKENEKKRHEKEQKEQEEWENSLKMNASDAKTENTTKRMGFMKTLNRLGTRTKK